MNKIKILYICFNYESFVKKDVDMLKKNFDVKFLLYKGIKHIVSFLPKLFVEILRSDVIISRFASTHAFFAVLFSKILQKKSVVILGGFDVANVPEIGYGFARSCIKKMILKFTLISADKVLPISNFLKNEAIKIAGKRDNIQTVYLGFSPEKWKPGKKENIVLTVCGELTKLVIKRKGLDTFVEAAKYVPEAKFIVIGKRTEESEELIRKAPKNVEFVDFLPQDRLLEYYQRAKVYCQLSIYEGFGNSLGEAMLCECVPVVTKTKFAEFPMIVKDTGFYVPYGDAKATAEAIKKALNSDKGKKARKRIKTLFPLERREATLFNIVHDLLGDEHEKLS